MKNKVVCITQARMTSNRLPGKIMKKVNGKPLLAYHIERLKEIKQVDEIIIATTTNKEDDIVADFAKEAQVTCFRGSEHNVLERFYLAAVEANADYVLRVTSDCPILDPYLHNKLISLLKKDQSLDGYSVEIESFCRGLDGELFTMNTLEIAYYNAIDSLDKEHVTRYIYQNFNNFKWKTITNKINISHLRLCVDTNEDFLEIKRVIELLEAQPIDYSWENIVKLAY